MKERFSFIFAIKVIETVAKAPENQKYSALTDDIIQKAHSIKYNEGFTAGLMADLLNVLLRDTMDTHQLRGEYQTDCDACNKCRIIRTIATETHQPQIILAVHGPHQRHGTPAYVNTTEGRVPIGDTDMRMRGRIRKKGY